MIVHEFLRNYSICRIRKKDKHDRATVEQVMDPRTRIILFKMLNSGVISEINGCISTGKEANVYHATPGPNKRDTTADFAIKIYKTSILVFKDRDRYVTGEFRFVVLQYKLVNSSFCVTYILHGLIVWCRFRRGYCRHNPRKMVRLWAEKELRNLTRMHNVGLPVPKPRLLKSHVLLMDFIGRDGWPAPKLKVRIIFSIVSTNFRS